MKKRKTRRQHMPKKIVMFGGKRVLYILTRTDRKRGAVLPEVQEEADQRESQGETQRKGEILEEGKNEAGGKSDCTEV